MLPNIPQGTGQRLTVKNNSKTPVAPGVRWRTLRPRACVIHWASSPSLRSLFLLLSTLAAVAVWDSQPPSLVSQPFQQSSKSFPTDCKPGEERLSHLHHGRRWGTKLHLLWVCVHTHARALTRTPGHWGWDPAVISIADHLWASFKIFTWVCERRTRAPDREQMHRPSLSWSACRVCLLRRQLEYAWDRCLSIPRAVSKGWACSLGQRRHQGPALLASLSSELGGWCCRLRASWKHMDPSSPSRRSRRKFKEHSSTVIAASQGERCRVQWTYQP